MKNNVFRLLRCPVCKAELLQDDLQKWCRCEGVKPHSFDFARSGYLNLAGGRAGEGDLKNAVLARRAFLDAGYYQCLSNKINEILDAVPSDLVLDAGCGEGYYTNRMAKNRAVLGIDLSKDGVDYAARRAKLNDTGAGFAVASVFEMPIKDATLDAVVNIFAPCAEAEYSRVLRNGGHLLVVSAGEQHLMGLKRVLYENPYLNQGRADLPKTMTLVQKYRLKDEIYLEDPLLIEALFSMTPYYWRTSQEDHQKLKNAERLITEIDFDIFLFRKDS